MPGSPFNKEWDAFLSYAHEDKADFVLPLANLLRKEGMKIWFDEFEIEPGDSITRSIETGLAKSRLGIIVISQASLRKNWTKYEISVLKLLYVNYRRRLIPIWKDVDADTIGGTDPGLLDIRAIELKDRTLEEIAYLIIGIARPDIFSGINSKLRSKVLDKTGTIKMIDPRLLAPSPRRREKLSRRDLSRIRLLHGIFFDVFRDSVEDWIDNFLRDLDYERELFFWEIVGALYLSWTRRHRYTRSAKKSIMWILMKVVEQHPPEDINKALSKLPKHVTRPLSNLIEEWNTDQQLIHGYLSHDLADDPRIEQLFDAFLARSVVRGRS